MRCSTSLHLVWVLCLVALADPSAAQRQGPDTLLMKFASVEVVSGCNASLAHLRNNSDSAEIAWPSVPAVRSTRYVSQSEKTYLAVAIGCAGPGEIILLDSALQTSVTHRYLTSFPSHYVSLQVPPLDLNGDGVTELVIYIHSGHRGAYYMFLSVFPDSLRPLTDSSTHDKFYASGGGAFFDDDDGDGVYDIRLKEAIWSGEENPPEERYTIMKWTGRHYRYVQTVEK